jgi:hypothetical protein
VADYPRDQSTNPLPNHEVVELARLQVAILFGFSTAFQNIFDFGGVEDREIQPLQLRQIACTTVNLDAIASCEKWQASQYMEGLPFCTTLKGWPTPGMAFFRG